MVVTGEVVVPGGVLVRQGRIAEVISPTVAIDAQEVIDLEGRLLLPGVVDDHVHFNEPGRSDWEGYRTGTMAAAAGGVTTVLDMPLNSTPPTINRAMLERKREAASTEAVVDYGQWGGLVDDNLNQLADLNAEGVIGYKAFMSDSGVDFPRVDDGLLYAGLERVGKMGSVMGVHAENEDVTAYLSKRLRADSRTDRASWCQSRPPETELEAIRRACHWAQFSGGNLLVLHVSLAEGVRAIAHAKLEGVGVMAETCPHYLIFDQEDFERIGPAAKCAPPLRSRENVEALWECVFDGFIETIGSDHSPCLWEDKAKGMDDIWQAWGGISGLQIMLPALLTEGVHKRGLPLPAVARMLAANPARLFGLYPQKGAILPGADADLVVVDLEKEWTLSEDQLFYRNKHSAYTGYRFKGAVERTFVRGETVYANGEIRVQPGFGKLVRRSYPHTFGATV